MGRLPQQVARQEAPVAAAHHRRPPWVCHACRHCCLEGCQAVLHVVLTDVARQRLQGLLAISCSSGSNHQAIITLM
jgi:hypothetical protein